MLGVRRARVGSMMLVLAKSRQKWYLIPMNTTLEETFEIARQRSAAEQEIIAIYVQHALANQPVSPEDASTLRGLAEALRGEGYTEAEMRHRMDARVAAAGL